MTTPFKHHLAFWRALADAYNQGHTVTEALQIAGSTLPGTAFEQVAQALIKAVENGAALHEAVEQHKSLFSPSISTMVHAGEAGGVLDVVFNRIVEGIEDKSFSLPGIAPPEGRDMIRFWRAFARLLSSGVPILEVFDLASSEISESNLREAIRKLRAAVREGGAMADSMRKFPDLFPEEVCAAIEFGELRSSLDRQAVRVSEALEVGNLKFLSTHIAPKEEPMAEGEDTAKAIQLANQLIHEAVARRASDIHLDPTEDGCGRIRFRVDGLLYDADRPPEGIFASLVNRIKIMACMDIAERRLPQLGRIMLKIEEAKYDLRVSTTPTVFGERLVIRVLCRDVAPISLERIGFSDEELKTIRSLCHLPNGLIITTGPTGSGKTTLLYSLIREVDADKSNVMSVEDPVEFLIPSVAQIQVNPRLGFTFPRALRSVFRQDPDVVFVGEMRDLETVQAAATFAITGHLVFTTLHAPTASSAVTRIADIGLEPLLINSTLRAVIAQRLIRKLCTKCRHKAKPDLAALPPEAADFIRGLKDATFYSAKGCDTCRSTGYSGRTAVHEILLMNDAIRSAVSASAPHNELRKAALKSGMKPLLIRGIEKAAEGITSLEEVIRVCHADFGE